MNTKEATIAVDAMGGDLGPQEVVAAVRLALEKLPHLKHLLLIGDESILNPLLKAEGISGDSRVRIHHAREVIGMEEKPRTALKKKDASMNQGFDLLKSGEASVLLSTGNTACLMAGGMLRLRSMPGLERAAIATVWPSPNRNFILIDAGANPDPKPEHLVHNALLGSHYARVVLGKEHPTVGLLTIGTEEGKGKKLITDTHEMLKKLGNMIAYKGPIEGFNVFESDIDVIVCDGFVGNILLKTSESLFHVMGDFLKEELEKSWIRKLGAFLAMPAFKAVKKRLNPEQFGGAPLLGLQGNVIKAHGGSNRIALMNAIRIGLDIMKHDMNDQIQHDVASANAIINEESAS